MSNRFLHLLWFLLFPVLVLPLLLLLVIFPLVMPPLLVLAPGLLLITAMVVTGSTTEKSKV